MDVISPCTPPLVHQEMIAAAAQEGKHIFGEKPMSRIATETRVMANACQTAVAKLGSKTTSVQESVGDVYYV